MNTAVLNSTSTGHTGFAKRWTLNVLLQQLKQLSSWHIDKPDWAHVPDRVWQRNSALLTYRHAAKLDRG